MNQMVPEFFRTIVWSSELEKIDPQQHKVLLIIQAINYGDLRHWRWIARQYGAAEVARVIERTPKSAIRPGAYRLAAQVFSISHESPSSRIINA